MSTPISMSEVEAQLKALPPAHRPVKKATSSIESKAIIYSCYRKGYTTDAIAKVMKLPYAKVSQIIRYGTDAMYFAETYSKLINAQ